MVVFVVCRLGHTCVVSVSVEVSCKVLVNIGLAEKKSYNRK